MKTYTIGDREFELRPLVLGQIRQLADLFEDVNLVELFSKDIDAFIKVAGKKLPRFIAIVLREKGKPLKEKDLEEITTLVEEEVDLETALRIVRDFFGVNDLKSLVERILQIIQEQPTGTGLRNSLSSSQMETSPRGKKSSGTIH